MSAPSKSYKIYVAGLNLERARAVMNKLRASGHTVTYDWVADYDRGSQYVEDHQLEAAIAEREAVRAADVLVYLWEQGQESARYEAGMALGRGIPVIAVGEHEAFFYSLPEVQRAASDDEIIDVLRSLDDTDLASS
jgi:nucleoside 2-deoxyribosyltransferase